MLNLKHNLSKIRQKSQNKQLWFKEILIQVLGQSHSNGISKMAYEFPGVTAFSTGKYA